MEYLNGFLDRKYLGKESRASYRRQILALSEHCGTDCLSSLTKEDLISYFSDLAHTASSATLSRTVSVVRSYYAYLLRQGAVEVNPMAGIRASQFEKKKESVLSSEDFARLIGERSAGVLELRDRAMLMLLCETGMRVSELVGLDREAWDSDRSLLTVGKGKRIRSVSLSPQTAKELEAYRSVSELQTHGEGKALFLNGMGKRLSRQGFWKNLKERADLMGVSRKITPQLLRRSLAYQRLNAGEEPEKVRRLLGNVNLASLRQFIKKKDGSNGNF